jgi:hypothetical protein
MITFVQDNTRFTYRVVGVAIEEGRVLHNLPLTLQHVVHVDT